MMDIIHNARKRRRSSTAEKNIENQKVEWKQEERESQPEFGKIMEDNRFDASDIEEASTAVAEWKEQLVIDGKGALKMPVMNPSNPTKLPGNISMV